MGPQDLLDALDEIVYVSDPNTMNCFTPTAAAVLCSPPGITRASHAMHCCRANPPLVLTAPMPGSHRTNFTFGNSTTLPWGGIFF